MILTIVTTVIVTLAGALIIVVLHRLVNKLTRMEKETTGTVGCLPNWVRDNAVYDVQLQRLIYTIKNEVNACKVVLGRFHNGGCFANGLDMKKFSLTHETPLGSTSPMMDKCTGVLNSRYASAFLHLATLDEYAISDIDDCPDPNFKHDAIAYGYKAVYLFLIKQYNGIEEGFVGVNFRETRVLTTEEREKIKDHLPTILGLVNMIDNGKNSK